MEGKVKIGILTACRTDNNGTDLQALAMQWIFDEQKITELINYKCEKLENSRKIFYPKSIKGLLSIPYNTIKHKNHEAFRRKYFKYSKVIYDKMSIKDNGYDVIVVGSDQIWNLQITGNDLSFFLPYAATQKKCSYAVSLGKTDITAWNKKYDLATLLHDFEYVSVREHSGVEALRKVGVEARVDLDPLLMIKTERWEKCFEKINVKKPFVMIYVLERLEEAVNFARTYIIDKEMDIIVFDNVIRPIKGVKVARFVSVGQWLNYVNEAELVITNSYHCLSFVINFHKKFCVLKLKNSIQSNTRLENLLATVGLNSFNDAIIYNLNWDNVEMNLNQKRAESYKYIENMVQEI